MAASAAPSIQRKKVPKRVPFWESGRLGDVWQAAIRPAAPESRANRHFRVCLGQSAYLDLVDQSNFLQNRRSRRSPVLLTARLVGDCGQFEVKLRNLSEDGALIEGEDLPPEGSAAHFERKDLRVKCSLVWVEGRYAGVAFARPLKAEDVLRQIPSPKPKVEIDVRRPGLACRALSDYERKMLETWMTDSRFTLGD